MSGTRMPSASPRRQRGAAAVFAAISLIAMLTMTALAIDVGRLYFAQRDLQRLANIAALDAVRVASGCATAGHPGSLAEVVTEVQASLSRNQDAESLAGVTAVTEVGRKQSSQGLRVFEALDEADEMRDAVKVTLSRETPSRIFPLISNSAAKTLTAVSVADQPARATFSVGSTTASVSGGMLNQLLGGLLCADGDTACQNNVIALDVAGASSGLADVGVSASQLALALGLSVEDLSNPVVLETTTPVLNDVLSGLASALSTSTSSAVSGLLQQLGAVASNPSTVPLVDLIEPALGAVSPDVPIINLLDLLVALGLSASADPDGVQSIELPDVEVAVPSIAGLPGVDVHAFLRVLESPRIGTGRVGEATANNAQVRLEVRASVETAALAVLVNTLGGTLADPLNIGIDVTAAQATATLESLQCPNGNVNDGMPVAVVEIDNSIADVALGTFTGAASAGGVLSESSTIPLLTLPAIPLLLPTGLTLAVGLSADVGTSQGDSTPEFRDFELKTSTENQTVYQACSTPGAACVASASFPNPRHIGTGVSIENLTVAVAPPVSSCPPLNLVCGLVKATLDSLLSLVNTLVNTVLTPLVNLLADFLINPLLDSLGLGLAGADLTMSTVDVAQPEIVTQSQIDGE